MTASGPASPTPIIDGDVNIPPFANQSNGLRREPRSPKVTVFLIGVGILCTTSLPFSIASPILPPKKPRIDLAVSDIMRIIPMMSAKKLTIFPPFSITLAIFSPTISFSLFWKSVVKKYLNISNGDFISSELFFIHSTHPVRSSMGAAINSPRIVIIGTIYGSSASNNSNIAPRTTDINPAIASAMGSKNGVIISLNNSANSIIVSSIGRNIVPKAFPNGRKNNIIAKLNKSSTACNIGDDFFIIFHIIPIVLTIAAMPPVIVASGPPKSSVIAFDTKVPATPPMAAPAAPPKAPPIALPTPLAAIPSALSTAPSFVSVIPVDSENIAPILEPALNEFTTSANALTTP